MRASPPLASAIGQPLPTQPRQGTTRDFSLVFVGSGGRSIRQDPPHLLPFKSSDRSQILKTVWPMRSKDSSNVARDSFILVVAVVVNVPLRVVPGVLERIVPEQIVPLGLRARLMPSLNSPKLPIIELGPASSHS